MLKKYWMAEKNMSIENG